MRLPSRVVVLSDEAHIETLAKRVSILDAVGVAEEVLPAVVRTDEPKALLGVPAERDTTDAGLGGGGGRRGMRRKMKRRRKRRRHRRRQHRRPFWPRGWSSRNRKSTFPL
eukprot:scaffold115664_cov39-Phaeocystis_antarctica.AAC.1